MGPAVHEIFKVGLRTDLTEQTTTHTKPHMQLQAIYFLFLSLLAFERGACTEGKDNLWHNRPCYRGLAEYFRCMLEIPKGPGCHNSVGTKVSGL